jgi:serine/threonine protein phosphatase PrpC
MQGWRLSMEDAHICNDNINGQGVGLFAIFDGHGGIEAAKFCERHFLEVLLRNPNFLSKQYAKALEETFLEMDNLMTNNINELVQISQEFPPAMTPL